MNHKKLFLVVLVVLLLLGLSAIAIISRAQVSSLPTPTGLIGVAIPPSKNFRDYGQVNLAWDISTDTRVVGYHLTHNGTEFGAVTIPAVPDSSLLQNTNYTYTVVSYDANGNVSAPSPSISVFVPSRPPKTPFKIGSIVITNNGMNVFSKGTTLNSTILCGQSGGVRGTIIDGLNQASGYYWWKVNFSSGCSGWVWQDYLSPVPVTNP